MTTGYGLSGSYISKGLCVFLLLMFINGRSQSTASEVSIKKSFSSVALQAYQQRSVLKLNDFYQYINILASTQTSPELASQVEQNIVGLFNSEFATVADFTSDDVKAISLTELLRKVRNSGITIEISSPASDSHIADSNWLMDYNISIKFHNRQKDLQLSQRIYLKKESKAFGDQQKKVWSLTLGEMIF